MAAGARRARTARCRLQRSRRGVDLPVQGLRRSHCLGRIGQRAAPGPGDGRAAAPACAVSVAGDRRRARHRNGEAGLVLQADASQAGGPGGPPRRPAARMDGRPSGTRPAPPPGAAGGAAHPAQSGRLGSAGPTTTARGVEGADAGPARGPQRNRHLQDQRAPRRPAFRLAAQDAIPRPAGAPVAEMDRLDSSSRLAGPPVSACSRLPSTPVCCLRRRRAAHPCRARP